MLIFFQAIVNTCERLGFNINPENIVGDFENLKSMQKSWFLVSISIIIIVLPLDSSKLEKALKFGIGRII